MTQYLAGVDLGGTYIKTALVTFEGEIVQKVEVDSEKEKGPDGVISNIHKSVEMAVEKAGCEIHDVKGIGIGSPGPMDTKEGIVTRPVNLPGWENVPLRKKVSEYFNLPGNLENDANAAAYGEYWKGGGQGSELMIAYTLGTGVGGGIVIRGHLVRGTNDVAGELGHMTIKDGGELCNCGNHGCLEAYASATALVRRSLAKLNSGAESILRKWIDEGRELSAKLINEARLEGDEFARDALEELGYYLGVGISAMVNALNPDVVVIGGGVMNAGDVILNPAREVVKEKTFSEFYENLKIEPAQLGNDAGVIGSAGLLIERGIVSQ